MQQKVMEDDTNIRLAQRIMKNRQYTMSTQADDEHSCDGAPTEKSKGKGTHLNNELDASQNLVKSPKRPKHVVVAIANFTNWMLHKILGLQQGCTMLLRHLEANIKKLINF